VLPSAVAREVASPRELARSRRQRRNRIRPVTFVLLLLSLSLLASSGPDPLCDGGEEREAAALEPQAPQLLALPLSAAPGATTVITAEEIARSGAANIFELLRRVPGVDIRYTPMGGHIGIRTTGSSPFSEEVLLLIDGTPYNSPDKGGFPGHPNYSGFFPLDRIARIEIIKGPISVLYGANAFGGVINIVSKRAADAVTDRIEGASYGGTLAAGDRALVERSARAAFIEGGWDATIEGGGLNGDTPIRANGEAAQGREYLYAAVRRGSVWGSILHQESRHGSFGFDGTDTLVAENSVDNVDVHFERRLQGLVLRGSASLNRYRGTTCAECHNNMSLEPDNSVTNDVGSVKEIDQRARISLRADRTLTDRQDLIAGIEAARDSIDRPIVRLPGSPSSRDGGGLFVQHEIRFAGSRFHLISGVRVDAAEGLGVVTSPRLAFVAEATDSLVLRASLGRAFRAPTWNERYIDQRFLPEAIGPNLIVTIHGNPALSREREDSAEAGLSWRVLPELVLKLDLYDNRIGSFIERAPGGFAAGTPNEIRQVYENRGRDFSIKGYEVTLVARPAKSLSLTAAYAYRGVTLAFDDPAAAYAPKNREVLSVAWDPGPSWALEADASHSSGYTVSFPDVFGVRPQPSYDLVDGAIRYRLPSARTKISVGLIGRNLTNAHPEETLVGPQIDTSLRGRSAAMEVHVDF
jgi:outer membrane receptor protein involved in Fe transport